MKEKKKPKSLAGEVWEKFLGGAAFGLGQALGLTLIFALLLRYLGQFVQTLGGIPYIGTLLANLISATEQALQKIK